MTISGAGFDPDAALDAVSFGHTRAQVTAATATALTVTVPETAGSGPVTVAAGGRSAPSPAPFLVVPSALDPADKAVDATVAVDGPSTTVSLPSKDKYALVRFDGSRGQQRSASERAAAPWRTARGWSFSTRTAPGSAATSTTSAAGLTS